MESIAKAFILKMTQSSIKQVVHSKRKAVHFEKTCVSSYDTAPRQTCVLIPFIYSLFTPTLTKDLLSHLLDSLSTPQVGGNSDVPSKVT